MKFNIVKKPKKKDDDEEFLDEEELELEEESDRDEKSSGAGDDAKKKMFKFMGIIVGITLILLLLLFIISLFTHKSYSYDQIEKILVNAATSYFKDYPASLPKQDGDIVEIDSSNLVVAGKMKDLSEYTKKGVVCSAKVQVEKAGSDYLYIPFLNCGDNYSTVLFSQKIKTDNPTVTSGYGLYANGGTYTFRGEGLNNYVQLDKSLWRIVKITGNDEIVLVNNDGISISKVWDDRYNSEARGNVGLNSFDVSRMKDYLDKVYKSTDSKNYKTIFSDSDRSKLVSFDLCIGKRRKSNETKDNSLECSTVARGQKLGLLTMSDYLYASVDPNCKSGATMVCSNYNYLVADYGWWLITASDKDTSTVFYISNSGSVESSSANALRKVRPVIHLNSKVMYMSGSGTLKDPYKLK